MTLESWAKVVLQRHGGHFSQHPVLSFLISNMLVRSRNRRIAQGRLKRAAFRRVEGIHRRLTPERLREAQKEMSETGRTTDEDVLALMKELLLYGSRHPLSNESRLSMRKKIRSMIAAFGLTAIWFTVNPNDINNPVKLKLAAHRGRDGEAAAAFLRALSTALQVTTLSIHDPLSSTLFFFREITLFFEHYVRPGRPSIYGNVSHYYATVETNDRGALHLHGLLWLDGNIDLADLVRDMGNPAEEEYRTKVKRFVNDVFTATLDEALVKEAMEGGKKTTVVEPELMQLQTDDSAGLAIPGLPTGTILIKNTTVAVPGHMRGKTTRSRGKPGFRSVTHRTGPHCTPAFAMTDQKSQGKQFSEVLVNLKGVHSSGTATRPSFMSLYVQLSRVERWEGLHLFRRPERGDFIEPKNVLDKEMRDAIRGLERRGEETRRRFEQDHGNETWFREWDAKHEKNKEHSHEFNRTK